MKQISSNDEPSPIRDEQSRLERIVSYLDGELTPVENDLLERELLEDDSLRTEMQSLDRAWAALDALPVSKVDDRFSQTTLEMVIEEARSELQQKTLALPVLRRRQWLANALLAVSAGVLTLLIVFLVRENPNRRLLADLPAIQYIDIYTQFQDVSFLADLHKQLGDPPWTNSITEEELQDLAAEFDTIETSASREAWVNGLDAEGQSILRTHYNQFEAISDQQQERLRALNEELTSSPDREKLVLTMLAYQQWLLGLPASLQFELREMKPQDRVDRVVGMVKRELPPHNIELSAEELSNLRKELLAMREQVISQLPEEQRKHAESSNPMSWRWLMSARRFPFFLQKIRSAVLASLSEENRAQFDELDLRSQNEQMFRWLQQVRGPNERRRFSGSRFSGTVSQEEMERFFVEELNAGERERLLAMPRDQMERQLEQRIQRSFLPGDFPDDPWFDRDGPPRGFGEPRNGPRGRGRGFGPGREWLDDRPPPHPDEGFGPPRELPAGFGSEPPPREDQPPR